MPIYRRCGRCGRRIQAGSRCPCLKERHKEYDKFSRDKRSKTFYDSKEWEQARRDTLELDGYIDVYVFVKTGKMIVANEVHHINPLRDVWEKRCDTNNLISLSHESHSEIEQMYRKNKEETQKMLSEMIRIYRAEADGGG